MRHLEDGFAICFTPADGPRRRIRFERRGNGEGKWWQIEEEHTGVSWRTIGREPVSDVTVDAVEGNGIVEVFRGP